METFHLKRIYKSHGDGFVLLFGFLISIVFLMLLFFLILPELISHSNSIQAKIPILLIGLFLGYLPFLFYKLLKKQKPNGTLLVYQFSFDNEKLTIISPENKEVSIKLQNMTYITTQLTHFRSKGFEKKLNDILIAYTELGKSKMIRINYDGVNPNDFVLLLTKLKSFTGKVITPREINDDITQRKFLFE